MKFLVDSHTHTLASGHAYSTLLENIEGAKKNGIQLLCATDHGVTMPGGPHMFYFSNLQVVPSVIDGVEILKGIEANIIDYEGNIDIDEWHLERLDIALVSYHPPCITPASEVEHTKGLLNVMKKDYVNILAHTGTPKFPFAHDEVVAAAKEYGVMIEVNNSSLDESGFRAGSKENCIKILEKCIQYRVPITVGSDAHMANQVGSFPWAEKLLSEINFPKELIMNLYPEEFKKIIAQKRKVKSV